jgi:hypothetical protein
MHGFGTASTLIEFGEGHADTALVHGYFTLNDRSYSFDPMLARLLARQLPEDERLSIEKWTRENE